MLGLGIIAPIRGSRERRSSTPSHNDATRISEPPGRQMSLFSTRHPSRTSCRPVPVLANVRTPMHDALMDPRVATLIGIPLCSPFVSYAPEKIRCHSGLAYKFLLDSGVDFPSQFTVHATAAIVKSESAILNDERVARRLNGGL